MSQVLPVCRPRRGGRLSIHPHDTEAIPPAPVEGPSPDTSQPRLRQFRLDADAEVVAGGRVQASLVEDLVERARQVAASTDEAFLDQQEVELDQAYAAVGGESVIEDALARRYAADPEAFSPLI